MLFALRQPAVLLGLVIGFAAGMIALSGATRLLDRNSRYPTPFWHPQAWLDPYGAVAALLAGTGWAPRREVRRGFGKSQHHQLWAVAAITVVVPAILAAVGLGVYVALTSRAVLPFVDSYPVLHGFTGAAVTFGQKVALGFGIENLTVAILSLVPIPPLATGVAVWTVLPRTAGSRQLAYRMLEEHWGIVALLVLFLVPLAGDGPLLLVLVTTISNGIIHSL